MSEQIDHFTLILFRLSTPTQGTIDQEQSVVQLKDNPRWAEFYDSVEEKLIKCLQSKGVLFKMMFYNPVRLVCNRHISKKLTPTIMNACRNFI